MSTEQATWVHAVGVVVAKAISSAAVQLRKAGETGLAIRLETMHRDWTRAVRQRCDRLEGHAALPTAPPRPVGIEAWDQHVAALRGEYAGRQRHLRHLVNVRDSSKRTRRQAEVGNVG